jgi:hypothetical protein
VNWADPADCGVAHPYVYREDCQQKTYLWLDCFDSGNSAATGRTGRTASTKKGFFALSSVTEAVHVLSSSVVLSISLTSN